MLLARLTLLAVLVAGSATPVLAGVTPIGPIDRGRCAGLTICPTPPLRPIDRGRCAKPNICSPTPPPRPIR